MEDQFVTFKQAFTLKTIGFDLPCIWYYFDGITSTSINLEPVNYNADSSSSMFVSKPLKSQVFAWFRKQHNLLSWVFTPFGVRNGYFHEIVNLSKIVIEGGFSSGQSSQYETYEEAESACIDRLIEIKNKLNDLERSN